MNFPEPKKEVICERELLHIYIMPWVHLFVLCSTIHAFESGQKMHWQQILLALSILTY